MSEHPNHTGRELELMLAGEKPLAMFYAEVSELPWEELVPEEAFAPYVNAGRFIRRDVDVDTVDSSGAPSNLRYVFYALPSEEWRIRVMTVLKQALHSGAGWNETCERVEGTLLGYSDAENNAHCLRVFRQVTP